MYPVLLGVKEIMVEKIQSNLQEAPSVVEKHTSESFHTGPCGMCSDELAQKRHLS
jgi:hypothetical protein